MTVRATVETSGFERLAGQTQSALLAQLRENGQVIEAAIKEEAPRATGNLADHIRLGSIVPFGEHRFQISVDIDLDQVPYYYSVIRGYPQQTVGEPGKKYWTGTQFWIGPYVIGPRAANNFPRRAIRRVAPEIVGLTARNFITRVSQ